MAAYLKYDQITSGQDRDILEKQFDLLKRVSENPEAILAMINDHKIGEKEGDAAVMECHSKDEVLTLVNKRFNTLFSNLCEKIGANLPETDSDISQYDSFLQLSNAVKAIKDAGDYDGKSLSP